MLTGVFAEGDIALIDVDEDGEPFVKRCEPGEVCEEDPEIAFTSARAAEED
eukprot:CAMPEP_0183809228 /NCGR_PEP_ID=MMETSP0803_2-20130417/45106_1 /TAXON_ID=195967 /ORGANISM="Crustomastix stigmata, Strain CCMP3273" /LENGTH=50 /DNA_ID=CAMNT_0026054043 /DNA_START=1 /DNA_END=153 /DNA_ORIENTATION=-